MRLRLEKKIGSQVKKQNATQNQRQIQNINAHQFLAFTSALPAISSSHTAGRPRRAAPCRAVDWRLEQKIKKQNKIK
jgi:hypothetical protein